MVVKQTVRPPHERVPAICSSRAFNSKLYSSSVSSGRIDMKRPNDRSGSSTGITNCQWWYCCCCSCWGWGRCDDEWTNWGGSNFPTNEAHLLFEYAQNWDPLFATHPQGDSRFYFYTNTPTLGDEGGGGEIRRTPSSWSVRSSFRSVSSRLQK